MGGSTISTQLSKLDVSNVFIYVGDAVRKDYAHPQIKDSGASIRSIASSTHSSKSFASLITGKYPPKHGVETFADRLNSNHQTLFDIDGYSTEFLNSIFAHATREHGADVDPIYPLLRMKPPDISGPFEDVQEPFVVMERGPGGHAPYGDFDAGATEYFRQKGGASKHKIQSDYEQSIKLDTELFINRLNRLEEMGVRENTLAIYTSDHGEMLGDRGLLGHNGPMCPELVYIPAVFIHPDLDEINTETTTYHHVDLLPTVFDLLGAYDSVPDDIDGHSLLSRVPESPRPCFWSNRFFNDKLFVSGKLVYDGVWDASGGLVFAHNSPLERVLVFVGKLLQSSKSKYMKNNAIAGFKSYLSGDQTYKNPRFDVEDAESIIDYARTGSVQSDDQQLSSDARDHLRDLGYME